MYIYIYVYYVFVFINGYEKVQIRVFGPTIRTPVPDVQIAVETMQKPFGFKPL